MMVWRGPGGAWSGGPGGVVRCVVNGLLSTHKSQLCFGFTILGISVTPLGWLNTVLGTSLYLSIIYAYCTSLCELVSYCHRLIP